LAGKVALGRRRNAEWNRRIWFVWVCACLPESSYKKPTSEICFDARTPRCENRPAFCSELIWEEQVGLWANLLSSTKLLRRL